LNYDSKILEISLLKMSEAFNEFIAECMTSDGLGKTPSMGALMKARGYLPPYCDKAHKKRSKTNDER